MLVGSDGSVEWVGSTPAAEGEDKEVARRYAQAVVFGIKL